MLFPMTRSRLVAALAFSLLLMSAGCGAPGATETAVTAPTTTSTTELPTSTTQVDTPTSMPAATDTSAPPRTLAPTEVATSTEVEPTPAGTQTPSASATQGAPSYTWQRSGLAGNNITGLAILPQGANVVLAAGPVGVWRSSYDYRTWDASPLAFGSGGKFSYVSIGSASAMYLTNNTGCASGLPSERYRSIDEGKSWEKMTGDAMTVAAANGGIAYATTCFSVVKTTDSGTTWAELAGSKLTDYDPHSIATSPDGQLLFVAYTSEGGTGRIMNSSDAGATWKEITPKPVGDEPIQAPGNLVYVEGSEGRPQDAGLYMTSAEGLWFLPAESSDWKLVKKQASANNPQIDFYTTALFVDTAYSVDYEKPGPVIYEARERFGDQGAIGLGAFRSIDGGATWVSIGHGLDEKKVINSLLLAPRDTVANPNMVETLIAGTNDGIWTIPMPPPFK